MNREQAFRKSARLLTPHDFKRVFDQVSFRLSSASFVILVRTNTLPAARLGLIIAKKNARRAVDRNRIKRIVRETFRHQQHSLGSCDYAVMTRKGIDRADNDSLREEIDQLWHDAQLRAIPAKNGKHPL